MGLASFIKLGKTAVQGKQTWDNFNPQTATSLGKKTATAPLKAWENIPRWVLRGLQLLLGLVVIGFYGHYVDVDRKAGAKQSPEWVYGVTVGGISCITAVVFALLAPVGAVSDKFKTHRLFAWDMVIFILWIVVFGVFAGIFLKRDDKEDYKGANTKTMRGVVWLDLTNAVLWLMSGTYGLIKTFLGRKVDSLGNKAAGKWFGGKSKASKQELYEV